MDKFTKQIEKNIEYNRERKRMNEIFMKDIDIEKYQREIFKESYERIQAQIDEFYMKYATAEGVSILEAKRRANVLDVTAFQDRAKKAVLERDFSHPTNKFLKIFNLKQSVSRLELMKAQIELELYFMYQQSYDGIYEALTQEVIEEFENQAGILGASTAVTPEQIQKIVLMDFHGKNFSERVWGKNGYFRNHKKEIDASMRAIFTDMNGYQKERARLQKIFETSHAETMRLLKTEVSRVNSQAREQMYKQNGFTHYIYVTEPGACEICIPLEGREFRVEEREIGVNSAPMHPNCRCRDYGIVK